MKISRFEDLRIWKLSMEITKEIYAFIKRKGISGDFELRDQIKRACISVSANIAEGFEKNNNKEEFSSQLFNHSTYKLFN